MTCKEFLDATLALMVAPAVLGAPPATRAEVSRRTLGRGGPQVSCIGLGGYHIGMIPDEAESLRLMRRAIDGGITFLDNSWDYNGGRSEERMGRALQDGYRQRAFLMTKLASSSPASTPRRGWTRRSRWPAASRPPRPRRSRRCSPAPPGPRRTGPSSATR
jgi:Aldo/keto reductase family